MTFMKLDFVEESRNECQKILSQNESGNVLELFPSRLALICFLQMEEYKRLRNEEEFEKWKKYGMQFLNKKCGTGRTTMLKSTYQVMHDRFEATGNKKLQKKYAKKIKKCARPFAWVNRKFFQY